MEYIQVTLPVDMSIMEYIPVSFPGNRSIMEYIPVIVSSDGDRSVIWMAR